MTYQLIDTSQFNARREMVDFLVLGKPVRTPGRLIIEGPNPVQLNTRGGHAIVMQELANRRDVFGDLRVSNLVFYATSLEVDFDPHGDAIYSLSYRSVEYDPNYCKMRLDAQSTNIN